MLNIAIDLNLRWIYLTTRTKIHDELKTVVNEKLDDIGDQILLNYQIFREYNTVRFLNLTNTILTDAFFDNSYYSPQYPLDH